LDSSCICGIVIGINPTFSACPCLCPCLACSACLVSFPYLPQRSPPLSPAQDGHSSCEMLPKEDALVVLVLFFVVIIVLVHPIELDGTDVDHLEVCPAFGAVQSVTEFDGGLKVNLFPAVRAICCDGSRRCLVRHNGSPLYLLSMLPHRQVNNKSSIDPGCAKRVEKAYQASGKRPRSMPFLACYLLGSSFSGHVR